jgi:NAD(P)H-quinone oxidoreductase subunit 5
MESPTPVSALMHAGIINAGGALLLRLSPLIVQVPSALLVLVAAGTLTAVLGLLCMWAQVKVKRTLAWSTVSQMGFMMVQCGLGAFAAAMLHIVAHGCYKAWSFLRSGDVPPPSVQPPPASAVRTLSFVALGTVVAVPALALASRITGFAPLHSPGEMALAAVLALSIGQLWAALFSSPGQGIVQRIAVALITTMAASIAAFGLYRAAQWFLLPVTGELTSPTGWAALLAAVLAVAALVLLIILRAILPSLSANRSARALHVHALHGFYFGVLADRFVSAVYGFFSNGNKHVK